ncbi:hypothetical protein MPSEU_000476500 [Mayamaea pseudoterrestris]|nr:hypothetical protein MPSEU_000476500 [Mayamaea pseudoterrestris]
MRSERAIRRQDEPTAILTALESQKDYRDRSNIDAIRRHAQDLLEGQTPWNDTLFLRTLKAIVRYGEVDLFANTTIELSAEYKRNRADSFMKRLNETLDDAEGAISVPSAPQPPRALKDSPPARRPEHDKFRIIPKKIYDKTIVKNSMDTH